MSQKLPHLDPELYALLRGIARRVHRHRTGPHDTLQPTALLHEAWMKLQASDAQYEDRAHLLNTAARAMRQILVDRARRRGAVRHGANAARTSLSGLGDDPREFTDVIALDAALTELEGLDPEGAQVVLLRTFAGLTVPEVAEALALSERTVNSRWRFARAWLATRLAR